MLKSIVKLVAFVATTAQAAHNILDYGAMADNDSLRAEKANAAAFLAALSAANSTAELSEREVIVPANMTFNMLAVSADNWSNMMITINGTIKLSKRHHFWPLDAKGDVLDFMMFRDIENVTFSGSGTVDGQGYMWWLREFL